jgi:hypothetical protein
MGDPLTADEIARVIDRLRRGGAVNVGTEEDSYTYYGREGHFGLDVGCRGHHDLSVVTEDEVRAAIAQYPNDFRTLLG